MEKLLLVPQMKVVKKIKNVKMVHSDVVQMEKLHLKDQISKVVLNVLKR